VASSIVKRVGPPDKLKKSKPPAPVSEGENYEAPDAEMDGDDEEGDSEAAALGMAEAFADAVKGGDAAEILSAFRDLRDGC
jgi:hypothetical protein